MYITLHTATGEPVYIDPRVYAADEKVVFLCRLKAETQMHIRRAMA